MASQARMRQIIKNNLKDSFYGGGQGEGLVRYQYGDGMYAGDFGGAMTPAQRAAYQQGLKDAGYRSLKGVKGIKKADRLIISRDNEVARKAVKVRNYFKKLGVEPTAQQFDDQLALELQVPRKKAPARAANPNKVSAVVRNGIKKHGATGYLLRLNDQADRIKQLKREVGTILNQ